MKDAGPPGASSNGFNENLALFNSGKCGMWIDATVAASFVTDPKESKVADKVGFALAPNNGLGKSANWLWAWSLAVPAGSQEGRRGREVHRLGDRQALSRARRREGRLGQRSAGHAQLALRQPGIPEGGALRQADARTRSTRPIRRIRRSSRCPMSACSSWRSPSSRASAPTVGQHLLGRARRHDDRSTQALTERAERGDARDDQGRLYQVEARSLTGGSARLVSRAARRLGETAAQLPDAGDGHGDPTDADTGQVAGVAGRRSCCSSG